MITPGPIPVADQKCDGREMFEMPVITRDGCRQPRGMAARDIFTVFYYADNPDKCLVAVTPSKSRQLQRRKYATYAGRAYYSKFGLRVGKA